MNYIPVSEKTHGELRWRRPSNFIFAADELLCPTTIQEIKNLVRFFPITFFPSTDSYDLAIVLGFEQEFRNLFVAPDGRWVGEALPVAFSSYPFQLFPLENDGSEEVDTKALCIADDSVESELSGDGAAPFFTAEGKLASLASAIFDKLTAHHKYLNITKIACEKLAQLELIIPWTPTIPVLDQDIKYSGLYSIDEKRLCELPGETLRELMECNALSLAYLQLISMRNVDRFGQLLLAHRKVQTDSDSALDDLTFGSTDDDGLINLDSI